MNRFWHCTNMAMCWERRNDWLPHIQKLPEELEQLTKGDLADLVKGLLRNLEEGGDG